VKNSTVRRGFLDSDPGAREILFRPEGDNKGDPVEICYTSIRITSKSAQPNPYSASLQPNPGSGAPITLVHRETDVNGRGNTAFSPAIAQGQKPPPCAPSLQQVLMTATSTARYQPLGRIARIPAIYAATVALAAPVAPIWSTLWTSIKLSTLRLTSVALRKCTKFERMACGNAPCT
jgi:hypothetical protein